MEEDQVLSEEFTCSICGKSCGNKKSKIRHISYCQKSKSRVRSRKKSCLTCTKAKTRCDLAYPSCSRCITKNLTCGYEQPRLPKTPAVQVSETPVIQSPETALVPPQTPAEPIAELPSNLATTLVLARLFALHEHADPLHPLQSPVLDPAEFMSSDSSTWNFESTDLISTYLERVPAQTVSQYPRSFPPVMGSISGSSMDYPNSGMVDAILYEPVIAKAPKSFSPRTVRDHQFSLNRSYLLCSLHSYPHMILPGKPFPPFIHPHLLTEISRDGREIHKSLPRPLATCAAIVQMCLAKNESNVTFIWRTIRMEQERLSAECLEYDDVNALAALQAITIYFLLRLSEDNDEATNFDIPLIYTMMELAVHASQQLIRYGTPSDGRIPTWKDWILGESLRRTIIVLFFINLFFDVFSYLPFDNCDGRWLAGMSLPCARDLWRATSSAEWERQYLARGDDMLTYGDLLNWRSGADHTLDSWLSQLDDFGTLVMAAASLTE